MRLLQPLHGKGAVTGFTSRGPYESPRGTTLLPKLNAESKQKWTKCAAADSQICPLPWPRVATDLLQFCESQFDAAVARLCNGFAFGLKV